MGALRIVLQVVGIVVLIFAVTLITLRVDNQDADGPSILFPGGKLVSGELHTGAEPDWSFTDDVAIIELQLVNPLSSRIIFVMESEGKVYIGSGYMRSALGKIWKNWGRPTSICWPQRRLGPGEQFHRVQSRRRQPSY